MLYNEPIAFRHKRGIPMIDKQAFRGLSYGLYIIGAQSGDQRGGCVVNTLCQVTSSPAQVSVAINKENVTSRLVAESGRFTAVILDEDTPMDLIGTFGFRTSAEIDKFAEHPFAADAAGVPYVTEHTVSRFSAKVVQTIDVGTHLMFIGEVEEAESTGFGAPMTYAYYHQVKGGKTPPKASSFEGDATVAVKEEEAAPATEASGVRTAWRCTICGHIEYVDGPELPADFKCPLCGMGRELFEQGEL